MYQVINSLKKRLHDPITSSPLRRTGPYNIWALMGTVLDQNSSRRTLPPKHQGKVALLPNQTLSDQSSANTERCCLLTDVSQQLHKNAKPVAFYFQSRILYILWKTQGHPLSRTLSVCRLNEGFFVHIECHFRHCFTYWYHLFLIFGLTWWGPCFLIYMAEVALCHKLLHPVLKRKLV